MSYVQTQEAADKVFNELAPRYQSRVGGYTRVLPSRYRVKDSAKMAFIEYVDRPVSSLVLSFLVGREGTFLLRILVRDFHAGIRLHSGR